jgi:hypothetical protein
MEWFGLSSFSLNWGAFALSLSLFLSLSLSLSFSFSLSLSLSPSSPPLAQKRFLILTIRALMLE